MGESAVPQRSCAWAHARRWSLTLCFAFFLPTLTGFGTETNWNGLIRLAESAIVQIQTATASGSGFFVSPDGYVLTAAHVVNGASIVMVVLATDESYQAMVEMLDANADVALLKIPVTGRTWLTLGDSHETPFGAEIRVLGYPAPSVGVGMIAVAGVFEGVRLRDGTRFVQHNGDVEAGHSGGPVLNDRGQAIGITTEKWKLYSEFSIAVASDSVRELLPPGVLPPGASPVSPDAVPVISQEPAHSLSSRLFSTVVSAANPSWQPTGIYINEGDEITFSASGAVVWRWRACVKRGCTTSLVSDTCDPDGVSEGASVQGHLCPYLSRCALVGRIWNGNDQPFEFLIGRERTIRATKAGFLYLGMNDYTQYTDNSGAWNVSVTVLQYEP